MDKIFNASFMEFVKNEANCDLSGRELGRLVKDYKMDQIIHGFKWLVEDWSVEPTARLLKHVFYDWLPELSGMALAKIGGTWYVKSGNYQKKQKQKKERLLISWVLMGGGGG